MAYLYIVALLIMFAHPAMALTPPSGKEVLCAVEGKIVALTEEDATDAMMHPFKVPAIVLEVTTITASDGSENPSCRMPSLIENHSVFQGEKRINTYRICETTPDLKAGAHIKGIAGKSLGGGPYCIENIQVLGK